MKKPRVVFPYTEAGMGHITPMNAIADKFEELYGDCVEVVRSQFFTEGNNKKLSRFEWKLCDAVVRANKRSSFGFFMTRNMDFWGVRLSSWATMRFLVAGSNRAGVKHMRGLKPDMVVSTHWATNYYARQLKPRPLTAMYCPDAIVNPLFAYPCDLAMVSNSVGYQKARKKYRRFNEDNLKCVNNAIRGEAFEYYRKGKGAVREELGFDRDKFTVVLAEGGYGVGKTKEICERILNKNLPITLVPVCGKNEELFQELCGLKGNGVTDFRPVGYTEKFLELLAAADIFCGKSGANSCAEACFFGVPQIITKYATNIEQHLGEFYIDTVGCAMKIFDSQAIADRIAEFVAVPELLKPYQAAAEKIHGKFGAEDCARLVFELLCSRFPELKNGVESSRK